MRGFLLVLLIFTALSSAQTAYIPDANGIVSNPAFLELIKDRQYKIIGSFTTVSQKPLLQYAKVVRNGRWGFIDIYGNEVIPPIYDFLDEFDKGLVKATDFVITRGVRMSGDYVSGERYCFIDLYNSKVTMWYDDVYRLTEGVFYVKDGGKHGLLDNTGEVLLPLRYDQITFIPDSPFFAKEGMKWLLFDRHGKQLSGYQYDAIEFVNDFILAYTGDTFTLLNTITGKPLNNVEYEGTRSKPDTYSQSPVTMKGKILIVSKAGKVFLVDKSGRSVSAKYDDIIPCSEHYFIATNGKKKGLLNKRGKLVFDTIFDGIGTSDEKIFTSISSGARKYYDSRYKEIRIPVALNIYGFRNGLGVVKNKGKLGFINAKGRLIVPIIYDNFSPVYDNSDVFIVYKDNKCGVIDRNGKTILPCQYKDIQGFRNGYIVRTAEKTGVIDDNGKLIIPEEYEYIRWDYSKYYEVKAGGKCGIFTGDGKLTVPVIYNQIGNCSEELFQVQLNDKKGYSDKFGTIVIPLKYDFLGSFNHGLSIVTKKEDDYFIDRYGHEYQAAKDIFERIIYTFGFPF